MTTIHLSVNDPYHSIFSYPNFDHTLQLQRLDQLKRIGVECLFAEGDALYAGHPVLGVGYCGVVIAAKWQHRAVAIKVRRSSCRQDNLAQEARLHKRANELGVGPQLLAHHGDIIVMERLSGRCFATWLAQLSGDDAPLLQTMLGQLLWQGFTLDQAGIDHGALRCVSEHAFIVGKRLTILDFSHSSDCRHPNNVTSLVSGLLWGTKLAQTIQCLLTVPDRDHLLPQLRQYKQQPNRDSFKQLLQEIGLDKAV